MSSRVRMSHGARVRQRVPPTPRHSRAGAAAHARQVTAALEAATNQQWTPLGEDGVSWAIMQNDGLSRAARTAAERSLEIFRAAFDASALAVDDGRDLLQLICHAHRPSQMDPDDPDFCAHNRHPVSTSASACQ